jgi:hypothetical protein
MRGRWPRGPEGASADFVQYSSNRRLRRSEDVTRWNAERDDPAIFKPRVTLCVSARSTIEAMPFAINLDGQTQRRAVEIENVRANRMLSAEL